MFNSIVLSGEELEIILVFVLGETKGLWYKHSPKNITQWSTVVYGHYKMWMSQLSFNETKSDDILETKEKQKTKLEYTSTCAQTL